MGRVYGGDGRISREGSDDFPEWAEG